MRSITLLKLSLCFGLSSFVYADEAGVLEQWEVTKANCTKLAGDQALKVKTTLTCTELKSEWRQEEGDSVPFQTKKQNKYSLNYKGKPAGNQDDCLGEETHQAVCPTQRQWTKEVSEDIEFESCEALKAVSNPIEACEGVLAAKWDQVAEQEATEEFNPSSKKYVAEYKPTNKVFACSAEAPEKGQQQQQTGVQVGGIKQEVVVAEETCGKGEPEPACDPAPACDSTPVCDRSSSSSSSSSSSCTSESSPSRTSSCTTPTSPKSPSSSCTTESSDPSKTSSSSCTTPRSPSSVSSSDCPKPAPCGKAQTLGVLGGALVQPITGDTMRRGRIHLHSFQGVIVVQAPQAGTVAHNVGLTKGMIIESVGRGVGKVDIRTQQDLENYLNRIQKDAQAKGSKKARLSVKTAEEAADPKSAFKDVVFALKRS